MEDWKGMVASIREKVEEELGFVFDSAPACETRRVAEYATLRAGHRWRALFSVATSMVFGSGDKNFKLALPVACAGEMAHAASLVLDDLPSMDNASIRRGKPCAHLVFPKWAVDMAPVFLVTLGYKVLLNNPEASREKSALAAIRVSDAALNMIAGQEMDLLQPPEISTPEGLLDCYTRKTGALWGIGGWSTAFLCGASALQADKLYQCGLKTGLYYQFMDDVGDITGGIKQLGKGCRMDVKKSTSVDLFGLEGAIDKARSFQKEALSVADELGQNAQFLRHIIEKSTYTLD
jgi:geranylgeranyl pyrophosphate synthase